MLQQIPANHRNSSYSRTARIAVRCFFICQKLEGDVIMIAVLKHGTTPAQREQLVAWLRRMELDVHISEGAEDTVLGLIGDTSRVDMELLGSLDIVRSVKRISEPYKQVNRKFHPLDSVIGIGNTKIGGGSFAMIAGPCSVESEEQIIKSG